jgi:hypothetical protein
VWVCPPAIGTFSCNLAGVFTRFGPIVIIMSPVSVSLNGTCHGVSCTVSFPASLFIPVAGNGVTTGFTVALFAGAFLEFS